MIRKDYYAESYVANKLMIMPFLNSNKVKPRKIANVANEFIAYDDDDVVVRVIKEPYTNDCFIKLNSYDPNGTWLDTLEIRMEDTCQISHCFVSMSGRYIVIFYEKPEGEDEYYKKACYDIYELQRIQETTREMIIERNEQNMITQGGGGEERKSESKDENEISMFKVTKITEEPIEIQKISSEQTVEGRGEIYSY